MSKYFLGSLSLIMALPSADECSAKGDSSAQFIAVLRYNPSVEGFDSGVGSANCYSVSRHHYLLLIGESCLGSLFNFIDALNFIES
jgi:hypothetical protein